MKGCIRCHGPTDHEGNCERCDRERKALGPSDATACSAWVPVSNPPSDFTRVIAKNEDEAIADCVWLSKPKPGCYVIIPGAGAQRWQWATHYIPWPNENSPTVGATETDDE